MPALFITAVGTDVGKTHVACALIRALKVAGHAVDAFKPVLSGYDGPEGSDAARLLTALDRPLADLDRMSPLRFRAPLAPPSAARLEGATLALDELAGLCAARIGESVGLLLIEGAGGVLSPIAEAATNLDLAQALGQPLLLVTGSYLGAVSHTLTALEAIAARGLRLAAIVISESDGDPPPIAEMTGALETFAPQATRVIAPRADHWDASVLAAIVTQERP